MKLVINEKEYTIEFGMEAALCPEVIEVVARLVIENFAKQTDIRKINSFMAAVPRATVTLLYAGLLEHHGEDANKTIKSEKDAKFLLKSYFKSNPGVSFIDLLNELLEQIIEDNFVEKTGVSNFLNGKMRRKR